MYDLSKATDVEKFFADVVSELNGSMITGVYGISPFIYDRYKQGKRVGHGYMQDDPVYIVFDNGKCLVVEYYDINRLRVECRAMTDGERRDYDESNVKDLFDCTLTYRDGGRAERSVLLYGGLARVEAKRQREPYSAWVDGRIVDGIEPDGETFSEIEFVMTNGRRFVMCADDPENDGYSLLWSDDVVVRS